MKFTLTPAKPRNPLVAAARLRHAGAHRAAAKAQRQSARRALRQDLAEAARHGP